FALEPDHDDPDAKVIPLAYGGAPHPLARPRSRTVLRAIAAPIGAVLVLGLVGEIAVRAGRPGADAIAAATPFRRADALRQLREGLTLKTHLDGPTLDRAVALDKLRGRCADAADDLFEHHSFAAAAEMAAKCKDPWREGRAWFAMADMDRAAEAFLRGREPNAHMPYSLSEVTAYLGAKRWASAAEGLHGLA